MLVQYLKSPRHNKQIYVSRVQLKERISMRGDSQERQLAPNKSSDTDSNEIATYDDVILSNALLEIFQTCLGLDDIPEDVGFYQLGGTSILAVKVIQLIQKNLRIKLDVRELLNRGSLQQLKSLLKQNSFQKSKPSLVELREGGESDAIFLIHLDIASM